MCLKTFISAFVFFVSYIGFSQEKYKLIGLGLEGGKTPQSPYSSNHDDIVNMIDDPSFTQQDDSLVLSERPDLWRPRINYRIDAFFQKEGSNRLIKTGIQYDEGVNRQAVMYDYRDYYGIDTAIIYQDGNAETLYRDSLAYEQLLYTVRSRNVGLYGEYLLLLNKKSRHKIYTGVGLGIGYSVTQTVNRLYARGWQDVYTNQNTGVTYYGVHPVYSPVAGTHTLWNTELVQQSSTDVNKTFYLSPYIPLNIRTRLAADGFFSHLSLNLNASAGVKFEITKGVGIGARAFYGFSGGVSWMF